MKQFDSGNAAPLEEYTGRFFRRIFRSADNHHCVCLYQNKGDTQSVVGDNLPEVPYPVTFRGRWVHNKTYGRQFQVDMVVNQLPDGRKDIEQFIASQKIGIGTKRARQMIDLVGADKFWDALNEDPMQFEAISGVSQKSLILLQQKLQEMEQQKELIRLLSGFLTIGAKQYRKIMSVLGEEAVNVVALIRENPFVLMKCGYKFKELDVFCSRNTFFAVNDHKRLLAAAQQTLLDAKSSSHVALPQEVLLRNMQGLLSTQGAVDTEEILYFLRCAVVTGDICFSRNMYYLPRSCEEEKYIARTLRKMAGTIREDIPREKFETCISYYENKVGFKLAPAQIQAVWTALTRSVCVITGGPGTGKSTILDALLHCWKEFRDEDWLLMAPTGKASVRMTETTQQPAATIHSALGLNVGNEKIEEMDTWTNSISNSLIVVDEASMLDQTVMASLMLAVNSKDKIQHLALVGDPEQLPSVGWGNVLADLIDSGTIPLCRLETIFRQGQDSPIITNATRIQQGNVQLDWSKREFKGRDYGSDAANMQKACEFYRRCVEAYGIENVVLLSPYHRNKAISTDAMNKQLQAMLNPPNGAELKALGGVFRPGDRVMQLRNTDQLSNGDVGTVLSVDPRAKDDEPCIVVKFGKLEVSYIREDLVQLELAYAITVHKSQGSQYRAVLVILPQEPTDFLRRNILYTAITRSSQYVAIFGPERSVAACILNDKKDDRYTNLKARLA